MRRYSNFFVHTKYMQTKAYSVGNRKLTSLWAIRPHTAKEFNAEELGE